MFVVHLNFNSLPLCCTELHDVMLEIRLKITNRKNDKFFGSSVKDLLNKLNETDKATFYKDADIFFERCLDFEGWAILLVKLARFAQQL